MAFSAYSNTPGLNVTIGGVSVAEGGPPANINNAIRQLAADGKELSDEIANFGTFAPLDAPVFTGVPKVSGKGPIVHNANAGAVSGEEFFQTEATPLPAAIDGRKVFTY